MHSESYFKHLKKNWTPAFNGLKIGLLSCFFHFMHGLTGLEFFSHERRGIDFEISMKVSIK